MHRDGLAPELWSRHAAGGIARDGSPSGYEYAVVGEAGVLLLRPWWRDHAGALGDAGAATVYADWLEEVGRVDEALALRADVVVSRSP